MDREDQPVKPRPPGGADSATPQGRNAAGRRRGWSRRRFGRTLIAGAPILMTLPGGAVRAATGGLCTASGWASGNTSRHPEWECGGVSPGYWGNPGGGGGVSLWEDHHDELYFSAYGFNPGLSHPVFNGKTLMEVLYLGGGHSARFGRFSATALLNAKYIQAYALSEAQVREIVETTIRDGYYTTSTGERLSEEEVATFLESTWDSTYFGAWLTPNG